MLNNIAMHAQDPEYNKRNRKRERERVTERETKRTQQRERKCENLKNQKSSCFLCY